MTSKIKVDNINKVSDDSNIIKKCGTTVTVGAASDGVRTGADNLQAADGGNLISQSGTTITLGASGDTIALASGASQTGFGRTGTVDWQTGSIKTGTFTAANGEGYFANTTGSSFTMNLPAGSAGAIVSVQDYNNTFDSNSLIISPNGSEKINGGAGGASDTIELDTEGEGLTLVYIDGTVGWRSIHQSTFADQSSTELFVAASGGNTTATCGNYKIHTFTGPGTFTVTCAGNACGSNKLDYLVVAGGGGASGEFSGAGAGGFRESVPSPAAWAASPLAAPAGGLTASTSPGSYPIVVGAGGAANSNNGNPSTFSTITSTGGGAGTGAQGNTGGSGGGGSAEPAPQNAGGTGNTPPVSPPQGSNGGQGANCGGNPRGGGGGGGATAVGTAGSTGGVGAGGAGATTSISGSPVARAGGGGGAGNVPGNNTVGAGGTGGGGGPSPLAGVTNTGGGGAAFGRPSGTGGNGGSGIVIIRYKFQ